MNTISIRNSRYYHPVFCHYDADRYLEALTPLPAQGVYRVDGEGTWWLASGQPDRRLGGELTERQLIAHWLYTKYGQELASSALSTGLEIRVWERGLTLVHDCGQTVLNLVEKPEESLSHLQSLRAWTLGALVAYDGPEARLRIWRKAQALAISLSNEQTTLRVTIPEDLVPRFFTLINAKAQTNDFSSPDVTLAPSSNA